MLAWLMPSFMGDSDVYYRFCSRARTVWVKLTQTVRANAAYILKMYAALGLQVTERRHHWTAPAPDNLGSESGDEVGPQYIPCIFVLRYGASVA